MSAVIAHPDVSTDWIRATLLADATLMAMTVTIGGEARVLQGIFYMIAPQEQEFPYPCIIINQPVTHQLAQPMHANGPYISQAGFLQDVRICARDVEPDNAQLRAIRARVMTLLEGQNGTVTGGRTNHCVVRSFTPDQRLDRGSYIYVEIGVTFHISTQVG